jgi:hypothetical protein
VAFAWAAGGEPERTDAGKLIDPEIGFAAARDSLGRLPAAVVEKA